MPITTQDFEHGVDFTGIANANASDFNNLVDQSIPFDDTGGKGKGIFIVTIDTADDVPDVPDASVTTKWKRYAWLRKPFSITSSFILPRAYVWSDLKVSDATYLKWEVFTGDIDALQAQITALTAQVNTVEATANNAYSLATSVTGLANTALTTANSAQTTATNANDTATTANNLAQATAQQLIITDTNVTNAQSTANAAVTAAAAAQTAVNNFVASHATEVYVEQANQNIDLAGLVAGENHILLNAYVYGNGTGIATITAGKLQFINAGTYVIDADIPAYIFNERIQAQLIKDSDSSIKAWGTVATEQAANSSTHHSFIKTVITTGANEIFRFSLFALLGNGSLGKASNLGEEYYSIVRVDRIA
jgi:hypothetical protein